MLGLLSVKVSDGKFLYECQLQNCLGAILCGKCHKRVWPTLGNKCPSCKAVVASIVAMREGVITDIK